jgi:hypothetical protein
VQHPDEARDEGGQAGRPAAGGDAEHDEDQERHGGQGRPDTRERGRRDRHRQREQRDDAREREVVTQPGDTVGDAGARRADAGRGDCQRDHAPGGPRPPEQQRRDHPGGEAGEQHAQDDEER